MRRTSLLMLTIASSATGLWNLPLAQADDNPFARPMISRVNSNVVAAENVAAIETPVADEIAVDPLPQTPAPFSSPKDSSTNRFRTKLPTVQPALPAVPEFPAEELTAVQPAAPTALTAQVGEPDSVAQKYGSSIYGDNRIATTTDSVLMIPGLIVPTTRVEEIQDEIPVNFGGRALSRTEALPEGFDRSENWSLTSYFWNAPNTFSHPLYFEDVMLERHGHERFPLLQPLVSGGRFFATIPMLPYLAAVRDPWDCDYHLGYYRPGSCAPALWQRPPYDRRAAVIQAGATAGVMIGFP